MRTRATVVRDALSRVLIGAAIFAPITAAAQHPPKAPGRVAGIAPAPAPAPEPTRSHYVPPGTVFYGHIPVLVLNDGRVFANFGRGYEQVVRTCGLPVSYGGQAMTPSSSPAQPVVVQPIVTQPTIGTPTPALPYTPPVPSAPTQSQRMQSQITQPGQPDQWNNSQWCWAVGPTGRVFVGYP